MINILIPIAGKAQRFIDANYTAPKPLIMVDDRHMIDWALDSIDHDNCNLIFAVRKDHIQTYSIDKILKEKYGEGVHIVVIDQITEGTLCTCLLAKDIINWDTDPLVIYTPDVCFEPKFDPHFVASTGTDGFILTFKANSPAHSYALTDDQGVVSKTVEKEVISSNAAVGIYYFKRGSDFVKYAEEMVDRDIRTNNEFYICPIYNFLIRDGLKVTSSNVDKMHVLGTPDDLSFFTSNTLKRFGVKPVALCSDHSGLKFKGS
jgi:dTDP-glucose pyrophosphorylase